jgi:hypothetical protein
LQMYARLIKEFGFGAGSARATSFLRQLRLVNFEPDGACVAAARYAAGCGGCV